MLETAHLRPDVDMEDVVLERLLLEDAPMGLTQLVESITAIYNSSEEQIRRVCFGLNRRGFLEITGMSAFQIPKHLKRPIWDVV